MPTSSQDQDFAEAVVNYRNLLDNAIMWIAKNLNPSEVFSEKDLETWAEGEGYVKKTD